MIYSMTGYGRAEGTSGTRQIVVELKSVNGKQFEIINRINPLLKAHEPEMRNHLMNLLKRGSIDVNIIVRQDGAAKPMQVNTQLAKIYYNAMIQIAEDLQLNISTQQAELLSTIMRMPEVVAADADTLPEPDWIIIKNLLQQAATQLIAHRQQEGKTIEADLMSRVQAIETLLAEIEAHEPLRIERIKTRITDALQQNVPGDKIDENRFEQELIYYIEKIDFSEEKQRLRAHCDYYKKIIKQSQEDGIGKKLGFVLQEIGREINTLGSKANDSIIQQIVVNMKDELEKAKEQVLNIV